MMRILSYAAWSLCLLLCWQCSTNAVTEETDTETVATEEPVAETNPASPGFNATASDPEAIALADQIMQAMGGRAAWDATRYISWNFFGARQLLWDKETGRVRIDVPQDETVYLIDIDEPIAGQVFRAGEPLTQPDSLVKYAQQGKSIWINDAYWLVMPYKLKDSGVTLHYAGTGNNQAGEESEIIELTFENVGDTPQNKYRIYVNPISNMVTQWDYFANASDAEPRFSLPWQNYQPYGKIMLSGDRGERQLTDIAVYTDVPDAAFTNPATPDRSQWPQAQ